MAKKSYNPFKMWGSYVGIIGLPIFDFVILGWIFGIGARTGVSLILGTIARFQLPFPLTWVIYLPLGFLIGWGIHSLIRSARK